MKFPYLKEIGRDKGWNRVGPLARIIVCDPNRRVIPVLAESLAKRFEDEIAIGDSGNSASNETSM